MTYAKHQATGRLPSDPGCSKWYSDTHDTDMHGQIVSIPGHLPVDGLEQLHVADFFGEATLLEVTLEVSANDVTRNQGNGMHPKWRRGLDD